MMRLLTPVLLFLVAAIADAQTLRVLNTYKVLCDMTLSAAAGGCTVQQPATGSKTVRFIEAVVYCSVACEITASRDGTAASSTSSAPVALNAEAPTATTTGWKSSNVGAGTAVSAPLVLAADVVAVIDISRRQMTGNGTAKNFTLKTNSITGRAVIEMVYEEW